MKDKSDYINYRLQKAAQSLKEAKLLMENEMKILPEAGCIMLPYTPSMRYVQRRDSIRKHIV